MASIHHVEFAAALLGEQIRTCKVKGVGLDRPLEILVIVKEENQLMLSERHAVALPMGQHVVTAAGCFSVS